MNTMDKKEICIKIDAQQREETLISVLNKAQNALDKLSELGDIPCSCMEDLDLSKIKTFIQSNISTIEKTPIFTQSYKAGLIKEWDMKRAKAISLLRDIKQIFAECQGYAFTIEEGIITPETSLKAIAEAQSTKPVPEEAFEHYKRIEAVRTAIRELREFEKAQDLRKINVGEFMTISEEQIAEGWASGRIKIDRSFSHTQHRPKEMRNFVIGRTE